MKFVYTIYHSPIFIELVSLEFIVNFSAMLTKLTHIIAKNMGTLQSTTNATASTSTHN